MHAHRAVMQGQACKPQCVADLIVLGSSYARYRQWLRTQVRFQTACYMRWPTPYKWHAMPVFFVCRVKVIVNAVLASVGYCTCGPVLPVVVIDATYHT